MSAVLAGCGGDATSSPAAANATLDGGVPTTEAGAPISPPSAPFGSVTPGADAGPAPIDAAAPIPPGPLPACPADMLADAAGFSLYSLGGIAYSCSELAGVVGAARDIHLSRIGVRPAPAAVSRGIALAAGGILALNDAHVAPGGIESGGPVTLRNYSIEGDVRSGGTIDAAAGTHRGAFERVTSLLVDHGKVSQTLLSAADRIAAAVTSAPVAPGPDGVIALSAPAGVSTFAVTAADFQNAEGVRITAPSGAVVLVDVRGAGAVAIDATSFALNGGITPSGVLFNMAQVTRLTLHSSTFNGTLLAPRASTSFVSTRINGGLYVADLAANASGATPLAKMGTCEQAGGSLNAAPFRCGN